MWRSLFIEYRCKAKEQVYKLLASFPNIIHILFDGKLDIDEYLKRILKDTWTQDPKWCDYIVITPPVSQACYTYQGLILIHIFFFWFPPHSVEVTNNLQDQLSTLQRWWYTMLCTEIDLYRCLIIEYIWKLWELCERLWAFRVWLKRDVTRIWLSSFEADILSWYTKYQDI